MPYSVVKKMYPPNPGCDCHPLKIISIPDSDYANSNIILMSILPLLSSYMIQRIVITVSIDRVITTFEQLSLDKRALITFADRTPMSQASSR